MPQYTIFIGLDDGPDRYQQLPELIEASDPRTAAQLVLDRRLVHPDEQLPQILVIEEVHLGVFTRDDHGRAMTDEEEFERLVRDEPTAAEEKITRRAGRTMWEG